jgi:hypothetical protein
LSLGVILHIRARDLQLIPFNPVSGGDNSHYRWRYTTYFLQHTLWVWYCTLQLGIYNLFPLTLSVVVILHIRARDLQFIPFSTLCGGNTAHYGWGSATYSLQHCLWCWCCTLQLGTYNLFPSTLSVVVIVHITSWDLQLILFNTACWGDTAHYGWGSTTCSLQHCL